jgi:hypothetical protein
VEREWLWDAVRRELDRVPAVTQKKNKFREAKVAFFSFFPRKPT